jgi:hypothetical protein
MAAVQSGPAAAGDSANACKRLQKELMGLMMSTDEGISAFPDSDNMLNWTATLTGTQGTPYEGSCAPPARPCCSSTNHATPQAWLAGRIEPGLVLDVKSSLKRWCPSLTSSACGADKQDSRTS